MAQLSGDIELMPISDLVAWIANRNLTGQLTASRGNVERSFIVAKGLVRQGASTDTREYLGQHLINFGYINEQQLEKAFQTQRETTVPLGRILLMVGELTEEQLNRALAFKVRESLLDTFEWQTGSFSLEDGETGKREMDLVVAVALAEAHSEGLSRARLWREMRAIFPSGDLRCSVQSRPHACSAHDGRLLDLLAHGLTIGDLLLELRALDFHVYARLYDLHQRGHIRPLPAAPVAATAPAASEAATQETMRSALAQQDYGQAFTSAQRVLERDAHNAEALAAMRVSQQHVAADIKERGLDRGSVPTLLIDREQATSGQLTAKERYVLSRIDGERTLNQIIQVSPVSEVELLHIVEKLRAQGLVGLKKG
ncbi:MAG: DUF4388 domain-containing protein [Deltaproteobacteria bacterium]|nr:DUF4388 domain-containing protein [Deltaproteobacteria bacterium]